MAVLIVVLTTYLAIALSPLINYNLGLALQAVSMIALVLVALASLFRLARDGGGWGWLVVGLLVIPPFFGLLLFGGR